MNYFLGLDGGGTKTKAIIIDENGNVLLEHEGGPSSVDTVSIDITYSSIKEAIRPFVEKNPDIKFKSVFAGLGGIVFDEDQQRVRKKIFSLDSVTPTTKVVVENDMHNALYSGFLFNEGVVLIAGTGMVAFGKDLSGKQAKCGGWGYKEGDLGSGYYLGRSAIGYMVRAYDNRLPIDDFAKEIAEAIGLEKITDIISIMDDLYTNRTKVASLTPIVRKYADLKHPYALKIIDIGTDELVLAVKGVINQLSLKEKKLVVVGSIGNIDGEFKTSLHKKLHQNFPDLEILAPQIDPALAAALMAKNL